MLMYVSSKIVLQGPKHVAGSK